MNDWKKIVLNNNEFLISKDGIIYNPTTKRYLKGAKRKDGYYNIRLNKKNYLVHRLVAIAYLPNPNNYDQVNHKDENKSNNNVGNLEWCTRKYNINYGTGKWRKWENKTKHVIQKDLQGNLIKEWNSCYEIERELGFSQSNIRNVCNNYEWKGHHWKTHKGFIWEWK